MSKTRKKRKKASQYQYPDLATYFAESGDTQTRASIRLQIPQGYLSRVKDGFLMPSLERANRIAEYAGIPVSSFLHVYRLKQAQKGAAA